MKFKHFLVFTMAFALVALCTSCNKSSENKILGKWRAVSYQYRTSEKPEWETRTPPADQVSITEFRADGTCYKYENDELEDKGYWSYDKDNQKLTINGVTYDIVKLSSKEMVLDIKSDGDDWAEVQINLEKVK